MSSPPDQAKPLITALGGGDDTGGNPGDDALNSNTNDNAIRDEADTDQLTSGTWTNPNYWDEPWRLLAHWGYRIIAFLIDAVFLYIVLGLSVLLSTWIVEVLDLDPDVYHGTVGEGLSAWLSKVLMVTSWIMMFVTLIWGGLLEGKWGRTPGKAIMRLKVVSAKDHNKTIGIIRGIARIIIASSVLLLFMLSNMTMVRVSAIFYWAGLAFWLSNHLLWPLLDDQHQTFHDKATGSHVISTRPS